MSDVQVLVVGGGISGLATAWWLAQLGQDVQLWEANERTGGKIRSRHTQGYITEDAATLLMRFRPEVDDLVDGVGLADEKLYRSPASSRYIVNAGALTPVPMRLGAMVTSALWSMRGKLRLLAEPFIARGGRANETVSEFVTRRLGREMLERAMEPYLSGPLASDPDLAEARSVLPRLCELEDRYGSLTAGVLARRVIRRRTVCAATGFSFHGGMSALVDRLTTSLGSRVVARQRVMAIEPDGHGWRVEVRSDTGCRSVTANRVVMCCPADEVARLVAPLDPELSILTGGVGYAPVSVVHLGFERDAIGHSMDGTGFLVPRGESRSLTGCLWTSSMFPERAAPGKVLLTCYLGGSRNPAAIDWDDGETTGTALKEIELLVGTRAAPEFVHIHRHRQGLPLYHGAYQERLEAIDRCLQTHPRLYLEGNFRGGVSVQDRIVRAQLVATQICDRTLAERKHLPHPWRPAPARATSVRPAGGA